MKYRHVYAAGRHTAAMWTSISKGQIPRRLLRFFQSKRTSVWTRVDTSEQAPKRPLSLMGHKVYNSYKYFIRAMKCIGAGFASYKGEKASHRPRNTQASVSVGSRLSELFTGTPSDRTIWLVVAGVAAAIVGLGLLLAGRRRTL
jgi:hypothetical protein